MIYLDLETRSTLDLRKTSASNYSKHPGTEILLMCWAEDDGPINEILFLARDQVRCPWEPDEILIAHNAGFERSMYENILAPRFGWPHVPITQWRCTAARAASLALPRKLETCALALGLVEQKDTEGHALMLRMSKPRKPRKGEDPRGGPYWFDDRERIARLAAYCRQDVIVERAVHKTLGPLPTREQRLYELSEQINDRGINLDLDGATSAIALLQHNAEILTEELRDLTGGVIETPNQRDKILRFLRDHGCELQDLTKDTVARALSDGAPPRARRVLEIRQTLGLASTKKLGTMRVCADPDGRFRGAYVYHGAATGRWTGSKIQTQNLPRGDLHGDLVETALELIHRRDAEGIDLIFGDLPATVANCLRGLITAAPGKELLVVDFSKVEAVGIAWAAGQKDLLQQLREGVDSYRIMAGHIYGKSPGDVSKSERQVGKTAILGCGYGMGAARFLETCRINGLEITADLADRAVQTFREVNWAIKSWWDALSYAAIRAVETGRPQRCRKAWFFIESDWLKCKLSSGRQLAYYDPRIGQQVTPWGDIRPQLSRMTVINGQWVRQSTHGGLLAENVVSGFCRDLLVNAMWSLEEAGIYPVVMHTHDEIVVEVDAGEGSLAEMIELMCITPPWARTFPLRAEGFRCGRYRK